MNFVQRGFKTLSRVLNGFLDVSGAVMEAPEISGFSGASEGFRRLQGFSREIQISLEASLDDLGNDSETSRRTSKKLQKGLRCFKTFQGISLAFNGVI